MTTVCEYDTLAKLQDSRCFGLPGQDACFPESARAQAQHDPVVENETGADGRHQNPEQEEDEFFANQAMTERTQPRTDPAAGAEQGCRL